MSTLLKKKGTATFRPKAPARRAAGPPKPTASTTSIAASTPQPSAASQEQDRPLPSIETSSIVAKADPKPALSQPPSLAAAAATLPTPASTQVSSTTVTSEDNLYPTAKQNEGHAVPDASTTQPPQSAPPAIIPTPPSPAAPAATAPKPRAVKPPARRTAQPRKAVTPRKPSPELGEPENVPQVMPPAPMGVDPAPAESDDAVPVVPVEPMNPKKGRKRKAAVPEPAAEDEVEEEGSDESEIRATKTAKKSSAVRKPRRTSTTVDPDAPPTKRGGKKREPTPEDAEEQTIDPTAIKMSELTKDLRIGKKFSKHDEIEKRDSERKARQKARREDSSLPESDDDLRRTKPRQRQQTEEAPTVDVSSAGPRMRLVDGQIVIDEDSLALDRHKVAAANLGVLQIVDEDDFTTISTQANYMKKEKTKFWDFEAEEKFYDGLRQFGTDFEMIAMFFTDRSRRHIKLKYNKEEKVNPDKITAALIKERVPIDFDAFKTETGFEKREDYVAVEAFYKEIEDVDKAHTEEEARVDHELAETIRKKKESIYGNGGSEKENEALRPKRKQNKKNKASAFGGGEEVEDLGEI